MINASQTARHRLAAAVALGLAIFSANGMAQSQEQEVAQGTVIIDAAAVTSARTAGSAEFDKAKAATPAYLLELAYKGDYLRATKGQAKKQDAYMGHMNLGLTIAGEKAFDLPGSTVYVNVMHNHGNQINDIVGTQQGVDNIDAGEATGAKLYQLWWQQQFMNDKVSVLGGLYDLNTEFNVTESSGVFMHPAFGAGAELAQTGASLFPTTGLGLRLRGELSDQIYGQLAIIDAVPGNPDKPKGTHIRVTSKEGALWLGEAGWRIADGDRVVTKVALGTWRYSKKQDDLILGSADMRTNSGYYVISEQQLFKHEDGRRIMGFARYGIADKNVNAIKSDLVVGVALEGPVASRPDDILGIGLSRVSFSPKAQENQISNSEQVLKNETAIELTYKAKITEWLSVQPEIQYIKTSAENPTRDNDIVAGIRFEIGMSW